MPLSRRRFFQATLATALAPTLARRAHSAVKDSFAPTWESLVAQYRAPEWFRDAKFGIWAHWSAQCVPEQGDWYGRLMYLQGTPFYDHHVKTYGHPSKFGFMEIENLWQAEHWDPRGADGALQGRRREILRVAGESSRQPRQLHLTPPCVELHAGRAEEGHRRHLGEDRARTRPAFRCEQSLRARLALVPAGVRLRR